MQDLQLDHKNKTLVLKKDVIIKNELVYEYFNRLPQSKRIEMFKKALYIGVLALIEDRISAFLARTKNELGTELERLKILMDMRTEMFTKSAVKGKYAERDIMRVLNDFFDAKGWKDYAILVGDIQGKLKNVKTGDIMAYVEGREDLPIVVEVKFMKNLPVGDIATSDLKKNTNNIWGQLLESAVNREAKEAIIVFDTSISPDLHDKLGPVTWIPNVGYVVFVDMEGGNFSPLFAVYSILRSAVLELGEIKIQKEAIYRKIIQLVIGKIKELLKVRKMVEDNIKNNQKILKTIEKTLAQLEITQEYLEKLLNDEFSREELLKFLTGKKLEVKKA